MKANPEAEARWRADAEKRRAELEAQDAEREAERAAERKARLRQTTALVIETAAAVQAGMKAKTATNLQAGDLGLLTIAALVLASDRSL